MCITDNQLGAIAWSRASTDEFRVITSATIRGNFTELWNILESYKGDDNRPFVDMDHLHL